MSNEHKRESMEVLSDNKLIYLEQKSTEEVLYLQNFEMETSNIHEERKEKNLMDALLDELDTPSHENHLF